MLYRPGGSDKRISQQYDTVYADQIGGATGWLPVSKGDMLAVNVARAALTFGNAAQSLIAASAVAPEVQVLLEMKMYGGDPDVSARPMDQWQNIVVATERRVTRQGYVRLRVVNINNLDGTGVVMDLLVNRTGDSGGGGG